MIQLISFFGKYKNDIVYLYNILTQHVESVCVYNII